MDQQFSIIFVIILLGSLSVTANSDYSLKSISVILRHGDRTPEPIGLYPNDPYKNYTFEPFGLGSLTNVGRKRGYQVGTSLRSRYNEFLGDSYKYSEVSAFSTDYARTKMSLLLALAGVYPPKDEQKWHDSLDWQPIPINYVPNDIGTFMRPNNCPVYDKELRRVKNTTEYKKELSQFNELMKNLTTLTGREVNNVNIIFHLFHGLTAKRAMNLTLPEWTTNYFPTGPIIDATLFEYKTQSYNQYLNKLNGGMFVKKVLDSTVFSKNSNPQKVYLYSVHDNNIAGVLQALNVWNNIIPEYSSAVIFEFHEKDSEYFFKILYYKGIPAEFEELTIPGCVEYCPIDNFLLLTKDVLPDDILEACFGSSEESYLTPKSINSAEWIYEKIRKWFYP